MKVAIIGTGNVGLVSGACFASKGLDVVCVDIDAARVEAINAGRAPFYEQGLPELLEQTVGTTLRATLDLPSAVAGADVIMLAVGTPYNGTGIDLSQIRTAARQVGEAIDHENGYPLVMVKSTVLPGTTDGVVGPILEQTTGARIGEDFGLAMNPEFLREGQAVADFLDPDRIVFGGRDERCWRLQEELYRDFPETDIVRTDNATAEMIKYTSNSLLATMISFSNEIANLCATLPGVDVTEVMRGVHLDKRLSPIAKEPLPSPGDRLRPGILTYLMAGCGFGGSCLPKDVSSLVAFGEEQSSPMRILRSVLEVNAGQPGKVVELLRRHVDSLEGLRVAVLGLAFKPGTSDIRETPALPVIHQLHAEGADLSLYDPAAQPAIEAALRPAELPRIRYAQGLEDAIQNVRAAIVLTSWPEIRQLPDLLATLPEPPLVIDGRRMFEPGDLENYDGVGLGPDSSH